MKRHDVFLGLKRDLAMVRLLNWVPFLFVILLLLLLLLLYFCLCSLLHFLCRLFKLLLGLRSWWISLTDKWRTRRVGILLLLRPLMWSRRGSRSWIPSSLRLRGRRKALRLLWKGQERQVKTQRKQHHQVEDELATAKEQTKGLKKKLEDAEKDRN